jgi:hypothetical protein
MVHEERKEEWPYQSRLILYYTTSLLTTCETGVFTVIMSS